jgi:succinate dehydrogenase/fumarate reductase flavoprotein subunit
METKEDVGKIMDTDVLVIGGGMAGLPAALKAKEHGVDVLIVDKAYVGFAGMAPRGGNGILALPNEGSLDEYLEYVVGTVGNYLNDQNALEKYARMINPMLHQLIEWGVELSTDKDGEIALFPFEGSPIYNTGINLNATDNMRKTAVKKGVRIQNAVNVVSLIKLDDRVCGAVGFDINDGTFYIFRAKSVIVACGGCAYRATRMFTNNGEGNLLAWDAGAQMRNAEFAFVEIAAEETAETIHGGCKFVYNKNGENVWDKYVKWDAADVCVDMILGMETEMREGRGPLYTDLNIMRNSDEWKAETIGLFADEGGPKKLFEDKLSWMKRTTERENQYFHLGDKPVVTFSIHGNSGFVRVDENMRSNVKGLYVAGTDTANGSAIHGAAPLPAGQRGGSFMYCNVTGAISGTNAAEEAKGIDTVTDVPADLILELKRNTYAYLNKEGMITARQLFARIQDAVCPMDVFLRRNETSVTNALKQLENIKDDLSKLYAKDYHELKLCREVESLLFTSEIMLRAGLTRKESRNFHYREEFPKMDNENWLKWILVDNKDGDMVITTEDVPIDDYRFKPFGM